MLSFLVYSSSSLFVEKHQEKAFLQYMRDTKNYFVGDEYQFRLGIFLANVRRIQEINREGRSFKAGINHLCHLTPAEYRTLLGAKPAEIQFKGTKTKRSADPPEKIDWRDKGVVNGVKDQGTCGSCWAFSTTTVEESQWAIAGNGLIQLSEQNIVDCCNTCYGCSGGWPYKAFDYIIKHQSGQFALESDYPYINADGSCYFDDIKSPVAKVTSYTTIESGSEDDLMDKVANVGPVSVCVDASHFSFQIYCGGVYNEPSCSTTSLDHAVAVVGYGSEEGTPYWLVRNSWGPYWGSNGYIKMIRNYGNQCGIATNAIIPNIN